MDDARPRRRGQLVQGAPHRGVMGRSTARHALDARASAALGAGLAYLVLATLAPIVLTPYRQDDAINRNFPITLSAGGRSLLPSALHEIASQVTSWMANQGRFFPGSVIWTISVFSVFRDRLTYKIFLVVLALALTILIARLAATLTRTTSSVTAVVVGLGSTVTLRLWADALDSFAGLLPLTIGLAVASTLLLLRGRGRASVVLAVMLWSIALLTYEVAIVVTPVLCVAVWYARRGMPRSLALVWPSLLDGLGVLYLRAHAVAEAPAYQTSFALRRVVATYIRQAAAALPLAQEWYPGSSSLHISRTLIGLLTICIGAPAAWLLARSRRAGGQPTWPSLGILALVGGWFWLAPPVLVAVTVRWQETLPPGQGYLSAVWGYVGVALLLAALWLAFAKLYTERPSTLTLAAFALVTGALSVLVAANIAQSLTIAEHFAPLIS